MSGFRDTGVPRDEGQHLQTVYPAPGSHGRPGQFGWNPAAHMTEASPLVGPAARDALFAQWAPYWDTARPFLLEKSPPNLIRARFFQALFPRSKFIVLRRHPVPVAVSTRRWTPVPFYSLVHHWVFCHETWARDRPFVREVIEITYEGLVAEPAATLRAITGFLGAAPFASVPVRPRPGGERPVLPPLDRLQASAARAAHPGPHRAPLRAPHPPLGLQLPLRGPGRRRRGPQPRGQRRAPMTALSERCVIVAGMHRSGRRR